MKGLFVRIVFLIHRLPYTPNRGDRIRAFHIFRQLAARHGVHFVSFVHDADEAGHTRDLEPIGGSVVGVPVRRWARATPSVVGLAGSRPLTHLLLHSSRMTSVLRTLVERVKPEVVVAYCTGMARYALKPPLSDLPWILDMVDVDSEKWAALSELARLPRPGQLREIRHRSPAPLLELIEAGPTAGRARPATQ